MAFMIIEKQNFDVSQETQTNQVDLVESIILKFQPMEHHKTSFENPVDPDQLVSSEAS